MTVKEIVYYSCPVCGHERFIRTSPVEHCGKIRIKSDGSKKFVGAEKKSKPVRTYRCRSCSVVVNLKEAV